jgi:pimeloyl-ACP methyl ester carboxylesterase
MTNNSFVYQDVPIYYLEKGSGKAVLLLHGFGEAGWVWAEQMESLSGFCRVIVPDLPGSGSSPANADFDKDLRIDDLAEAILALVNFLQIEKLVVLGHSMGGYIALSMAAKVPERLLGLGLVHSTAFEDSDEKKQVRQKAIRFIEENGSAAFLKTSIPGLYAAEFAQANPEKINAHIEAAQQSANASLIGYYVAMMSRKSAIELLVDNKTPLLFVMGTEDVAAPMTDVLQQTGLSKKSYFHLLQGVGHMGMIEAPTAIKRYLSQFIQTL